MKMKLTLAIIVFIGLYTASASPHERSKKLNEEYQQLLKIAEEYAVSPEMNRAYNLRTLTWAKSDSANDDFKSKYIEAFKEHPLVKQSSEHPESSKGQAAYDTLTEEITNLFFCIGGTSQPKRVNSDIDDSELTICPICFNPVTLGGIHRIVATECGHLFGDSCIRKSLSGDSKRCPTCREPAGELRKLYTTKIVVLDNKFQEERDELKKKVMALEKEMEMHNIDDSSDEDDDDDDDDDILQRHQGLD